ncbi:TolC family outer membrane protein [Pseudomonas sp. UBA2684]|uniref:TolC family outer membrane protein n=1 Tax=Pseudomonas sp. UBA2684 TaxID=1947311 RepID=UPI0025F5E5AD|nr:TolC family outer membrane protein [Pseudomonas sp. UBA2684]|tara:strand:- start:1948 stop:3300 length:1353 start_codon:yes stop_codon:yes gene_type:complete
MSRISRQQWLALAVLFCALSLPLQAADLLQAYREALQHDVQFAAAQAQYKAGLEQRAQRRAGLLPQLSMDAQNTWNQTQYEVASGDVEYRQQNRTYSIQLVQPLFRWQSWVQYQQGRQLSALAASRQSIAYQELVLRVAEAYFNVLNAEEVFGAVIQLRTADAEHLASARKNFELGNVSIADVHEAQASFDRALAQAIKAENDLELARHALARVIGRQPEHLLTLRPGIVLKAPQPNRVDAWVEAATQGNFGVQAQELSLHIASDEVRSRQAEHLPTLDLVASQNMHERPNLGTERSESASVGLRLSMPLYGGGRTSSAVREAQSLKVQAEAELEDARRAAALAAREAWLGVVGGMAQIRALEAATRSAQSAVDANRLGYKVGVRIGIDVLEVQSQLSDTVQQLSRARYDTLLAQLRLKAAVGSLGEADLHEVNALLAAAPCAFGGDGCG